MKHPLAVCRVAVVTVAAIITGCSSLPPLSPQAAQLMTARPLPAGAEKPHDLPAIEGRIVEAQECLLLQRSSGELSALIFAAGFSLDRASNTFHGPKGEGKGTRTSVRLGQRARFSGADISRDAAESETGMILPQRCPDTVFRIDHVL